MEGRLAEVWVDTKQKTVATPKKEEPSRGHRGVNHGGGAPGLGCSQAKNLQEEWLQHEAVGKHLASPASLPSSSLLRWLTRTQNPRATESR